MRRRPPLRIEWVAPKRLRPNPENPRRIGADARSRLRAGLERFGWLGPIVARRGDRMVLGGNQRLDIALEHGEPLVPVVYVAGLSDAEARAVTILLNNPEAQGEWDEAKLERALAGIPRELLPATGFSQASLRSLAAHFEPENAGPRDDAIPEPPSAPRSELGGVYGLGPHRLICADATEAGGVAESEIGQDRAVDLFLTDPPYAIYGSSSGLSADITDDKIVRPFFRSVLLLAKRTVREFGHVYVFCDWRSWASWWEMAKQAGLDVKNCLVWDKGGAGLGNNYANTHEFVAFLANLPPQPAMASRRRAGQRPVLKPNLVRHDRASGEDRLHNAAKPVALLAELMENSSEPGDLVLDPFVGSGSTIIAAERTGRRCVAVEVDPRWCDVTRQRYADLVRDPALSPTGRLTAPDGAVAKREGAELAPDDAEAPSSPRPARAGRRKGAAP